MNRLFSSHFRVLGMVLELELITLQVRLNAIK